MQTCESAARKFQHRMFAEFGEWFNLAARMRSRIADGDFEAFNLVVNGFSKLHGAAFKHHGLENTTINVIVMAGDNTDAVESLCAEPASSASH
jgi:hypothetical protein